MIDGNELNLLLYYKSQVEAIYEVFNHVHMKVAVFGRFVFFFFGSFVFSVKLTIIIGRYLLLAFEKLKNYFSVFVIFFLCIEISTVQLCIKLVNLFLKLYSQT